MFTVYKYITPMFHIPISHHSSLFPHVFNADSLTSFCGCNLQAYTHTVSPPLSCKARMLQMLRFLSLETTWFLVVILLLLVSSQSQEGERSMPESLNVGVLMPLNTSVGRLTRMALDMAVEEINEDPSVLNATKLVLVYGDTRANAYHTVKAALELFKANTIAFVGPQDLADSHIIAQLANEVHVPVVSFLTASSSLAGFNSPYFTTVKYTDAEQMAAIAEILQYYGWKEVNAVFMDDVYGNDALDSLQKKLKSFGSRVVFKALFSGNSDSASIANELKMSVNNKSQIFVLHMQGQLAHKILSTAYSLGMFTTGFVWIVTDEISNYLDAVISYDMDLSKEMQGVIGIKTYIPESWKLKSFLSELKFRVKSNAENQLVDNHVLFVHDALWMIALAVDRHLLKKSTHLYGKSLSHPLSSYSSDIPTYGESYKRNLDVFTEGRALLNQILSINFTGITGPVKLDSNGQRTGPTFEMVNFIGKGLRTVGYWSNQSFYKKVRLYSYFEHSLTESVKQQLDDVIWPGGTAQTPSGLVGSSPKHKLRIAVPLKTGYREFVSISRDQEGHTFYNGFCVEVFKSALSRLPYEVHYEFVPFGNGKTNPNYDELPEKVAKKEFDAAVGDIVITSKRLLQVDFTQPFISSGLVVVVPQRHYSPNHTWAFLKPFSSSLWLCILVLALVTAMVIWTLEHRRNVHFQGQSKGRIVKNILFILSTIFSSQSEDVDSVLGRIVLFVWLFVVLIITQSYTAFLTSILTVENLGPTIDGITAVISRRVPIGYQTGSFVEDYLEKMGVNRERLKPLNNKSTYAAALNKGPAGGGVGAIVDELPYVQMFLSSSCDFEISGQMFRNSNWGFAFPKGSELARDISSAILDLSDSGELQRLHDKWLKQPQCSTSKTESTKLHTGAFWGVFIITGGMSAVAVIGYFTLQCVRFNQIPPSDTTETKGRPSVTNFFKYLGTFFSFIYHDANQQKDSKGKENDHDHPKHNDIELQNCSQNNTHGNSKDEILEEHS